MEDAQLPGPPEAGSALAWAGDERRCSSCAALVATDAEWCGQCYAPLAKERAKPSSREAASPPRGAPSGSGGTIAVAAPGGGAVEVSQGTASWDCPVCDERNPIEASVCAVCQTPFARLFEQPSSRPRIEPRTAALWSLALPGLGHWKVGQQLDGVARMVLFAWTFGTVLVILTSGGGLGSASVLLTLYVASAAAVYAVSAADAFRLASDAAPLLPTRTLLWASAALVLVSIVLSIFVTLPATRG